MEVINSPALISGIRLKLYCDILNVIIDTDNIEEDRKPINKLQTKS